jgi:DNA gyrase/topoisomerase IV subunit B
LDYDCTVLTEDSSYLHFNIDRGYEHYFCVLDESFYKNIYLPIAKKLAEIELMDVRFVGKATGTRYGGNCYRNAKFIEGLLINNQSRVNRIKGLGESRAEDVANYLLYPETRTLRRITLADINATAKVASVCLGKDIENRKKLCMTGTY